MANIPIYQALQLALQHHQAGRLAAAEALYRQILTVQPDNANAWHYLGVIALQAGRADLALEWISRSMTFDSCNSTAFSNLGEAYRALGRLDEAVTAYRRAIEIKPDNAQAYNNLGISLAAKDRTEDAITAYRCALQIDPRYPEAYNNLGTALQSQGSLDEAVAAHRHALEIRPEFAEAYNNLANTLWIRGDLEGAADACRRAIELQPGYVAAHVNLGNVLQSQGKLDDAATTFRRALELSSDQPEAYNNLGAVFRDQGSPDDSISAFRQALAIRPDYMEARSNVLYTMLFLTDADEAATAEEHRWWNSRATTIRGQSPRKYRNYPDSRRRLRVGYVSPAFRDDVVGRNLAPLFEHHNRRDIEVMCYAEVIKADELTERFRGASDLWRNTVGMSDDALSEMIQHDGVDILVDLTQHMRGNRLPVFARQPAPVQVSFAGYPAGTGLTAIGYRISDRWLEQGGIPNSDGLLVKANGHEQVYLIDSFWCYDPFGVDVQVNGLPAEASTTITFGNLNSFCKVNDLMLKLWARVLREVKNSRLIILSQEGSHRRRILHFLQGEGVDPHCVEFLAPRPRKEYLELYHRLDVMLDTFPYNGHTTSLDALWMGVPVVSLCGERPVSRAGLSQLSNLGLPELVAHTEDQYVVIATQLANDIPRLKELRATLRERMEKSVLMDAPDFARQIEGCYRALWRQWCKAQVS